MRPRLINPFKVCIAQLDAQLSDQTVPGMDPIFREPRVGIDPNTHQRVTGRKESRIYLPAMIEGGTYQQLVMLANGIAPKTQLKLVFSYEDFEERGMVDDQRRNLPIRPTDRLVAIYSLDYDEGGYGPNGEGSSSGDDGGGGLLVAYPDPPGVFITESSPDGFMGGRVSLLVCTLGDRPQGKPAGG